MKILSTPFRALSFTTILWAAPLMLPVNAQANIAVPLPQISAQQISQDIERRQNPATGAVEYYAPSFDPFESIENIAGTVSLRSNTRVTANDGHILRGGALLDINFFYTTESDDPYDVAGFETAVFLSGEEARSVFYDNRIIECSEKVREVIYDKQYYNGASYGILAGIYRPYPRYRGHRHFGNRGFGYDWRYGGVNRRSGFNRRNRFGRNGRGGLRGDRRGRGDRARDRRERDSDRRRNRDNRYNDDSRHDDRRGDLRRNYNDRYDHDDNGRRGYRGDDSIGDRRRDGRRGEGRRGRGGNDSNPSLSENPDKYNYSPSRGLNTIKGGSRNTSEPRGNRRNERAGAPIKSRPVKAQPRTGQNIKRSEPARSQRTQPKQSRPVRSQPKQSRPVRSQPKRSQKSERRSSPPKRSRAPRSINKATSRSFKNNRPQIKSSHKLNFFPQGSYRSSTVSVSQRCAREENLSVYIPRDRLDAARYDGLTILALDRDGKDIPIYIPPNYIEGFRQTVFGVASASPSTYVSSQPIQADPPRPSGPSYGSGFGDDEAIVDYSNGAVIDGGEPSPQAESQYSSQQPIIYGDPNGVGTYRQWPENDP